MLHATKGIVFHTVRYAESGLVVKIYTSLFGLQSYLIKGVYGKRPKFRPGLFQPLTLLDCIVYHNDRHTLQSVKEVQLDHPYSAIPFDIRKSTVSLFLCELVYKAIREEESNPDLFEFLRSFFIHLDLTENPVTMTPVTFSLQLMHHLGIFPHDNHSPSAPVFNLREGFFQASIPGHTQYLDETDSLIFHRLLNIPAGSSGDQDIAETIPARQRQRMLETILLYYQLHLPGFKPLQSHHILHTVFT